MNDLRRALGYLKPYSRDTILAVTLLSITVVLDLAIPRLVQVIVDQGVATKNVQVIANTSLIMIGVSIVSALLAVANTFYSVRTAQGFAADLRSAAYRKVQTFSFRNLDDFRTGELIVRLTSDMNRLQAAVQISLRMLVRAPLMIAGSIILMLATNSMLATMILPMMLFILLLTTILARRIHPMFAAIQKRLERLNQVLEENLAGMRVVKAFSRRDYEVKRFGAANDDLMEQEVKVVRLLSALMPMMLLLINLGIVVIIYFGGSQIIAGRLTLGEIVAFVNYLISTMFPLFMLAMIAGPISAANASAVRVMEVMDSIPDIQDKPNARPLTDVRGRVVFEGVCFSYIKDCTDPVLEDINLVAEPGQTIAILGSTGSGKTSLVNLIPRFYDVTRGRITIDGTDLRDVTQQSLRAHIGISLQETVLFSGTIRDNIRYGREDATDEEVMVAAKAAQAHEFITSFPQGYDTPVGQRGVNLSGGQRQRVAIARALLVKPEILILDDSTSSVDVETEVKIRRELDELMRGRTNFVIAQRISTVLGADKIVVLDHGRVVAEGNHRELIKTSPIYQEIYESQLGNGGDSDE